MPGETGSGAGGVRSSHALPSAGELYYGGRWHTPRGGHLETFNPATGEALALVAEANAEDVNAAVDAAYRAYLDWRERDPIERAAKVREAARVMRAHAEELAYLDALNCGNPITAMVRDVEEGAAYMDYFAGLALELKGAVLPTLPNAVNFTVREPYGVCARIVAFNHPLMFAAMKLGAPLVAGNTIIIKPPPQAPLSTYRLAKLLDGIFPDGVFNVLSGGRECGEALARHPQVPLVTLVGSVASGRACARSAADRLKRVILELGGKNALIVYPDADVRQAVTVAIRGMNFAWCGQSCGSTSRLFLHESIYEPVLDGIVEAIAQFRPGLPTERSTTMGAVISRSQLERIEQFVELGKQEGARLLYGGKRPADPRLASGCFFEPTVFTDVNMKMRIAQEEIFGPVLCVLKWSSEERMFAEVNQVDYGLTAAICTTSLKNAHRAARRVEAGYVWVNDAGPHYVGAPFGGYKQSGIGTEGSIEELLAFTQTKNVHISL